MSMPRRRRGLSTLLALLALVLLIGGLAALSRGRTRAVHDQVHRSRLGVLARSLARSALEDLAAAVRRDANLPGTALFRTLRADLAAPWGFRDLTEHLAAPALPAPPRWGTTRGARGRAAASVVEYGVRLLGSRAGRGPGAADEKVAELELRVLVEVEDSTHATRLEVAAVHELRTLLLGPPRPFDQLALYLGDSRAVMDAARANRIRADALAAAAELRTRLDSLPRALDATDDLWARQIQEGLVPEAALARRVPPLTTRPAALLGFDPEALAVGFTELDLAGRLERIVARLAPRRARLAAATRLDRVAARDAYWMADEISNVFDAMWQVRRGVATHLPRDGRRYREEIEPFLDRLTAGHFLARVTLRPAVDAACLRGWLDGGSALDGVIDLRHLDEPLVLAGPLRGRAVVLVGPRGATLRGLGRGPDRDWDRVTLVSLGGDVRLEGRSRAAVLMLRPAEGGPVGSLEMGLDAHLQGSLLLPHSSRGDLTLRGTLEADPELRAPWPPAAAPADARAGILVALRPAPHRLEEVRR